MHHGHPDRVDRWLNKLEKTNGYVQADTQIQQQEISDYSEPASIHEWEFRISVLPTKLNLYKAHVALAKVMKKPEYSGLEFKALSLNGCATKQEEDDFIANEWDGTLRKEGDTDRNQRGKEICVYMTYLTRENKFHFTPEQWKKLMLDIWQAFIEADVKGIGYAPCPFGDMPVNAEPGMMTPFTYTSFKPYTERHGILNQGNPNPFHHQDPLVGVQFTEQDLAERGIIISAESRLERATHLEKHITESLDVAIAELVKIQLATKSNTDFAAMIGLIDRLLAKPAYDNAQDQVLLQELCKLIPKQEKSSLVDLDFVNELKGTLANPKFHSDFRKKLQELKEMIMEYQTNSNNNNRPNVYANAIRQLSGDFWQNAQIADCLASMLITMPVLERMCEQYPERMQQLYRHLVHITREAAYYEKIYAVRAAPGETIQERLRVVVGSGWATRENVSFFGKHHISRDRMELINQLNAYIERVQAYEKLPEPKANFRFIFGYKESQYYNRQANRILAEKLVEKLQESDDSLSDIFSDLITKRHQYASENVLFAGKNAKNMQYLQSGWFFREGIHSKELSEIIARGEEYANQKTQV